MVFCVIGCSRKKNNFLNRNWHAVTAEYNTLYNGNLALELGKQELSDSYFDNYWAILPVERMQLNEDVMLPGYTNNPNFERAEEKAIKAIQRHSMMIDGSEHNPQIDEAYLLLGKARYYDQRFVPALEAFNFILHKYPLSNTITEAKIWREKANIRMEFHEVAIENLKEILEQEDLKEDDKAHASAMLAQAYIDLAKEDSAITYISTAAELTDDNDLKGRYLFIKGQLYDFLGKKDSSNMAFDEVIELHRRTPREYYINAHIAKLQNMDVRGKDRVAALELLEELAEYRENLPYLDKIYFQMGDYFNGIDSLDMAVKFYNRSLRENSDDIYLRSLNYQTLGNINFDEADYQVAGAYYDSTLANLNQSSREYRMVKKKRDNLEDVIYYEDIAVKNDSILYLAGLSEDQRLEYFNQYTEELKAEGVEAVAVCFLFSYLNPLHEDRAASLPGRHRTANCPSASSAGSSPASQPAAAVARRATFDTGASPALAPSIAALLVKRMSAPPVPTLSPRETEVLALVAQGLSNPAIAAKLFVGEATVKTHLLHVFEKLEVNDRTRAVTRAMELGLL